MATLNINGRDVTVDVPADMPILWVLRDVVGLTGTKFGCGMALCGACTVHLEGQPIRSCVTPVSAAAGRTGASAPPSSRRRADPPWPGREPDDEYRIATRLCGGAHRHRGRAPARLPDR